MALRPAKLGVSLFRHPCRKPLPRGEGLCMLSWLCICAIVIVYCRCVLHRLCSTTCMRPCIEPLGIHARRPCRAECGATAPRPCRGLRPCDPIFIIDRGFSTVLQQTAGAVSCCFCFSLFKQPFPLLVIRHIPCKLCVEPCTVICLQKVCELVGNDIFRRRQRIFHKMNIERKYLL